MDTQALTDQLAKLTLIEISELTEKLFDQYNICLELSSDSWAIRRKINKIKGIND